MVVPAESVWPGVWADRAPAGAIVFPQIESRSDHLLEPLSRAETLRRMLPHSLEQWDGQMMPDHLSALTALAEVAPGYILHLGQEVGSIPELLLSRFGW